MITAVLPAFLPNSGLKVVHIFSVTSACTNGFRISANFSSRYLKAGTIKAILTVSLDEPLAYVIVAAGSVMTFCHKPDLCLKSSILMLNTRWNHANWCHLVAFVPSDKILNATVIFCNSFVTISAQKVLPFLASKVRACSTVSASFVPNLWLLLFGLLFTDCGNYSVKLCEHMVYWPVKSRQQIFHQAVNLQVTFLPCAWICWSERDIIL